MGLETSTYISGLVSTNPLGTDVVSKGDDHIRLLKSTIKASFPDVDEAVVTIHNGTTAPASKQTGTVWRDTTNSLWKFWNGSAWITLAVAFNTSNSVDVDAGTIDGVTIGGSVAPTVTDLGSVATCDLNGGTLDGMTIGASVAPTVTNIDINGGSIDGVTAGTNSAITELQVDNINVNGNAITSTDSNGDVTLTPNGTGDLVLDGQKWPQADGSSTNYLTTNGSGQLAWTTNTVAVSEANAGTSATNAATSEANALSYKNSAETAKTAAETAQTAAETALDNFDDRFLGAKASDPSVDNDGNALVDGAMFFDTTNNYMKVFSSSDNQWFQLTNTTSNQNNINTVSNIQANVTTVAGISSAVTGVNNISSDVSGVNSISSAVSAVNSNATNINTVSSNLASVNAFASTYRISSSAPTTSLDIGDLYFDSTANELKVYKSSGWAAAGSTVNGTSARYTYNISGTPTSVTGADANGETLAYDAGFADVFLNGVRLSASDITITSGTSVVFASALANGDVVDIVAYGTFQVASFSATALTSGVVGTDRLPTTSVAKGGTGLTALGAADTVLKVNSAGNALEYGTASSPEVYGFNVDSTGNLIVTTTNKGVDSISESTYSTFTDVIYSSSGMTWSLVGTLLRCTI